MSAWLLLSFSPFPERHLIPIWPRKQTPQFGNLGFIIIFAIPSSLFPELSEDWSSVREPVIEGVPFYVKYLGSSLVQKASGEEATADAIKTIVAMVSRRACRCFI